MYFVKIGELLFLRCPGMADKTAGDFGAGILSLRNIKRLRSRRRSNNPILRGIPPTAARTSPPLVTTMGTSGV